MLAVLAGPATHWHKKRVWSEGDQTPITAWKVRFEAAEPVAQLSVVTRW